MIKTVFILFLMACSAASDASLSCRDVFIHSSHQPVSQTEVREMLKQSRNGVREKTIPTHVREFFTRVLAQPLSLYETLPPKAALEYLSLFAQWRLLPPQKWNDTLLDTIQSQIVLWRSQEFLSFALQRKLTPLKLPAPLLNLYLLKLRETFAQMDANTQLETFSAELYHGHNWSADDLKFLIQTLTVSLQGSAETLRIKPLKETFRGLSFLTASEHCQLKTEIKNLVEQLDLKLQEYGFGLADGGTSGSLHSITISSDARYLTLAMELKMLFPGAKFRHEYLDPNKPGFYDPVDLLIVEPRLVVEWDGAHHYFRRISQSGIVNEGQTDLVLRPADQARDRILRSEGYNILRISPPLAKQLDSLDIFALITEQNQF